MTDNQFELLFGPSLRIVNDDLVKQDFFKCLPDQVKAVCMALVDIQACLVVCRILRDWGSSK